MKKERMNNKGFSLVELIIVVAIMAVLIVVLAPQYLKYVEKSRNATDVTNAVEIVTAIQVYAADPDAATALAAGNYTVTVNGTNTTISGDAGFATITTALDAAGFDVDTTANTMKTTAVSRTAWTEYAINVTVEATGNVTFDYTAGPGATAADAFKNAMAGKKATP